MKAADLGAPADAAAALVDLFRFDCQPSLFERDEQIDVTRASMFAALDKMAAWLETVGARSPGLQRLFDWSAFSVNGFYAAYHQRNDVALMKAFSAVLGDLVAAGEAPFTPRAPDAAAPSHLDFQPPKADLARL